MRHHHRHPVRPPGLQARRLRALAVRPRARAPTGRPAPGLSAVANVLWFILAGWWLALGHLVTGVLLCLTIIGLPLGVASFKMAGAALVPFGKEIVDARQAEGVVVAYAPPSR